MLTGAGITASENRQVMAYQKDGLIDIVLGLALLDAGAVLHGDDVPLAGLFVVLLYPLLLLAKQRITEPRIRPEDVCEAERSGRQAGALVSLGALAGLVLASLLLARRLAFQPPGWRPQDLWILVAWLGLGAVALAGYRLGAGRVVGYAAATLVALVAVRGLDLSMEYAVAAVGAAALVIGLVILARFIRQHPRRATSEP